MGGRARGAPLRAHTFQTPAHPHARQIDVWSLGCILVELLTGKVLFANDSIQVRARVCACARRRAACARALTPRARAPAPTSHPQTMLARIQSLCGPFPQHMIDEASGRERARERGARQEAAEGRPRSASSRSMCICVHTTPCTPPLLDFPHPSRARTP